MLLSNWYIKRKEKQIREAIEQARKQGYEEGYEAGKSGTRKAVRSGKDADIVAHSGKSGVTTRGNKPSVVTHGKKSK